MTCLVVHIINKQHNTLKLGFKQIFMTCDAFKEKLKNEIIKINRGKKRREIKKKRTINNTIKGINLISLVH